MFVLKDNGTGFRAVPPALVTVAARGGRRSSPQAFPPCFPTHGTGVPATSRTPALGVPSRQQRREGAGLEFNLQPSFPRFSWALLQPGSHRPGSESLTLCRPWLPSVKWETRVLSLPGVGEQPSSCPATAVPSQPLFPTGTSQVALAFPCSLGTQRTGDLAETQGGLPVVKTPSFQSKGCGFNPWSGNQNPTCCAVWPKKYK